MNSRIDNEYVEWDPDDVYDMARAECDQQNYGPRPQINLDFLLTGFLTREEKYHKKIKRMSFHERVAEWNKAKDRPLLSKWFKSYTKKCRSARLKAIVFGRKINFEF